jgi:hypothetical protein
MHAAPQVPLNRTLQVGDHSEETGDPVSFLPCHFLIMPVHQPLQGIVKWPESRGLYVNSSFENE